MASRRASRKASRKSGRSYFFLLPIIFLICLVQPAPNAGSAQGPQTPPLVESQVRNYVNALEIEKQERVSGTLKVRLRNVSGKDITAWSYTTGWVAHPGGQVTDGNATGDPLIAAGDVTELEFDRTTLYHISLHTPQNIALINIIAVVFDDLTAEGDARVTTEMIEGSKGCLVQLKRIRPLLKKVLEAPDSDFSLAVREFEAAISALPDLASPSQSAAFREGLADGKRYVELNLELVRKEITTKPVSIGRETLKHVIGGIERSLAKHSSRLTPSLR